MRKRVYLAGIFGVLVLITFGARPVGASQGQQDSRDTPSTRAITSNFEEGTLLAFAPPEDDDKPRKRRPKRAKDDDNLPPAKPAETAKTPAKGDPAKADDQEAAATPAAPEIPVVVGPTTVATAQESLTFFSIRLLGRIGERLAGTPAATETRPSQSKPSAQANTKKGAAAGKGEEKEAGSKMGKKSPFNRGKNEKGNNTAQNGGKKNGAEPAPVDPNAPVINIDPSKIGKAFRKGDNKKR